MKRLTLLASLLLLASLSMAAQEKQPSWLVRTVDGLLKSAVIPKAHFDTTYVFQTKLVWTVALEAERLRPYVDMSADFSAYLSILDQLSIQGGSLDVDLMDRPCYKLGVAAAYGTWRLGYGIQLGKREGVRDTYFGLGLNSAFYGGQIRYYKIHPDAAGTLSLDGGLPISLTAPMPGEMQVFTVDAFYAFNRHRFVNNAAYSARHVQRRSVGSWIATAKYLQGEFALDPEDPITTQFIDDYRCATRQFSLGGGYGYNWVLFHRDPVDEENGGLRNLTINATALPMVSLLNLVRAGEAGSDTPDAQYKNIPIFTPAVRGAIAYYWDRWSFCVESYFCHYGFQGSEVKVAIPASDRDARVKPRGAFVDFTVKAKLNLHF